MTADDLEILGVYKHTNADGSYALVSCLSATFRADDSPVRFLMAHEDFGLQHWPANDEEIGRLEKVGPDSSLLLAARPKKRGK